jgi:hypothetical protein
LELDYIESLRTKILLEDKEEDYAESIEEKFDEKTGKQWDRQQSRLHELITLICSCIRDNLNQEEGIYCLGFLHHITAKQD